MMVIWTGRPGSAKSYTMGQTLIEILYRNKSWYEKTGQKRFVYSNMRVDKAIEDFFHGFIEYWVDPMQVVKLRDVDIFWDEIGSHLDSARWADTPAEMKRWLQQHRKFGIEIYATAQDFAQIDIAAKRVVSDLFYLTKVAGSQDPSPTKPKIKYIWGLICAYRLDPATYDEKKSKMIFTSFPRFSLLTRQGINVFDTRQEIKGTQYPALHHIQQVCELDNCDFHRVRHV